MDYAHLLYFAIAAIVIWVFSGFLVDAVDRVARRMHLNGFTVAFFLLGLMTSISEISVMINATANGTPQVSAGNLSGASFVILMLIVPLLAIASNGFALGSYIHRSTFALSLGIILLPTLFLADGYASVFDGLCAVLCYLCLVYCLRRQPDAMAVIGKVEKELIHSKHASLWDLALIGVGALTILLAGHSLVEESVYVATFLGIPSSVMGLLVLSIGTNVPEIVVAVRSVRKHHADIAFGDYLGSAVANTLVFGILTLWNRGFFVEPTEFLYTLMFMGIGLTLLYIFASSKNTLSRWEGACLLGIYLLFLGIQLTNTILTL